MNGLDEIIPLSKTTLHILSRIDAGFHMDSSSSHELFMCDSSIGELHRPSSISIGELHRPAPIPNTDFLHRLNCRS
ncbi:hypothetical protein L6452_42738 [Arctium lappa]|uniref:Uncharacterized protein n=1 Tax=Arctium lappa TaxID=4217 RepID=A0ACB8XJ28_ARCLA|nr:hypothetical protein L6452_42738 [Arctium lappa]